MKTLLLLFVLLAILEFAAVPRRPPTWWA